jgi:Flp pilus assembly protein TadB
MIAMTGIGALIGAVIFTLIWRLAPPTTSPLVTLGRFDAYEQHAASSLADRSGVAAAGIPVPLTGPASWQSRLGRLLSEQLHRRGISYTSLRQDLALTGRSYEVAMGRKAVAFVAGFLVALLTAIALQVTAGLRLPLGSPAVLAVLIGTGFFFLPDLEARAEAADRRRDFRRALGAYLDLVALEMAGAAAPAEALPSAARVGAGWPLALLRDTLYRATAAGRDQWLALSELGERIGVPELRDLGALVHLVGRDGAQVRDTLTARASSMRRRELAEAEGEAGERDESMRMAQLLIGFGFIVFLGYPAIVAVMAL